MPNNKKENVAIRLLSVGICVLLYGVWGVCPTSVRAQEASGVSVGKEVSTGDSKIGLTPTASKLEDDKLPYEVKILKKSLVVSFRLYENVKLPKSSSIF